MQALEAMLAAGQSPETSDKVGMRGVLGGSPECILLRAPTTGCLLLPLQNGSRPLHLAAFAGHAAAVQALLRAGAAKQACNQVRQGLVPMPHAISTLLLDVHLGVYMPLFTIHAARRAVQCCSATGPHVRPRVAVPRLVQLGYTALHLAAWKGHSEVVAVLLQAGCMTDACTGKVNRECMAVWIALLRQRLEYGRAMSQLTCRP